jgi:acyl-coenzyme A synthetase/AMP-(fatty) acid ligase
MKTISRQILNENFELKVLLADSKLYDYDLKFIIRAVNGAKTFLIKEKNVQAGQKIVLINNAWPFYLIWFLAASELGLSFVVSDYPRLSNSFSVQKKLSLYGSIDYVIGYTEQDIWEYFLDDESQKIDFTDYFSYSDEHKDEFWATEDSILIYSTSSGSTGTPKVVAHNHKFFYDLALRNISLYDLKDQDKCLHSKGLHHGSVTGVFFLPTIMACNYHYYAEIHNENVMPADIWTDFVQREQITRLFLMDKSLRSFSQHLSLSKKQHDNLDVYVLSSIDYDIIDSIVNKHKYSIYSIFGCTETSGPLFLPSVTPENVQSFQHTKMGPILDNFYQIEIDHQQLLRVRMPNGDIVCTGDKFSIVNKDYFYGGRSTLHRIGETTIYLDLLIEAIENFLEKKHQDFFDIVLDKEAKKIWIRTDQYINLKRLNRFLRKEIIVPPHQYTETYMINGQLVGKRSEFVTGIKFDPEEIRIRCRRINI